MQAKMPKILNKPKQDKVETILKVTIKTMGELDKNNRKCDITILYKDHKGKNKIREEATDIKKLLEPKYFIHLKPEDKADVYLKCFHPSSSSTSSSSNSHQRKIKPAIQIFDNDLQEVKDLKAQCITSIQKEIKDVEIHNTLYNDKNKLRVKITIHYNQRDAKPVKKHIRKNHLLELYNNCIKTEQKHLIELEPTSNNNNTNNTNNNYIPTKPRRGNSLDEGFFNSTNKPKPERRASLDERSLNNHTHNANATSQNRTNANNTNGIMGLERNLKVSSSDTDSSKSESDDQCHCSLF